MSAVLLGTFTPGSPEWHAARAHGIGGSEIAPILGLSPFESRFSLWHRKAGNVGPVEETPEMEWGKRLEAATLQKFRDEHPEWTFTDEASTWCHPDRSWQIANPDMVGDVLVEAKHPLYADGWGEQGTDEVPIYYRTQGLWYCDVLEADRIHFAVLIGACDYREYVVEYDPAEAAQLRDAAEQFLADLAENRQPDLDGHNATYQVIRELHPEIDPETVELDEALAVRFIQARNLLTAAEENEQHARSLVADAMGTAQKATWADLTIATRQARKKADGSPGRPYVVAGRKLPDLTQVNDDPTDFTTPNHPTKEAA